MCACMNNETHLWIKTGLDVMQNPPLHTCVCVVCEHVYMCTNIFHPKVYHTQLGGMQLLNQVDDKLLALRGKDVG